MRASVGWDFWNLKGRGRTMGERNNGSAERRSCVPDNQWKKGNICEKEEQKNGRKHGMYLYIGQQPAEQHNEGQ